MTGARGPEVPRAPFTGENTMKLTAPGDVSGIDVGGAYFAATDGVITVPDDFSSEGLGALRAAGFAPVTAEPVAAPVIEPDGYGTQYTVEAE